MTEYRATVRVELVDDMPTFAEVVLESTDRAIRYATWPADNSAMTSLDGAAQRSLESLAARASRLGEEILQEAGMDLRGRWQFDRETIPANDGGTCGSVELSALVSGEP